MAVVYKKSELGSFLEELPNLILQFRKQSQDLQFQKDILEDKQEHDLKMQKDSQNFQAELSLYKDAKEEEREARNNLEDLIVDYQSTGADIGQLNELFRTDGALKILDNINEIPAKDYSRRAEHFNNKAEIHNKKSDILKDVLYGDIFKAQQIAAGGRPGLGYTGGLHSDRWDMGDINYDAYVAEYGENPIVKTYFEKIPGSLRASLNELEMSEVRIQQLADEAKKDRSLAGETEIEKRESDANKWLGNIIYHGSIDSGLNDYYMAIGITENPGDYEDEAVTNAKNAIPQIKASIGTDVAQLTGAAVDETMGIDEQIESLFSMYEKAHVHGTGRYETGLKNTGEASYDYLEGIIEDGWANYQTKDHATRKELDKAAQRLFGYTRKTFAEFVQEYNKYRTDILLTTPGMEDVLDENEIIDNEFEGLWE
jgi:hypothetical protein